MGDNPKSPDVNAPAASDGSRDETINPIGGVSYESGRAVCEKGHAGCFPDGETWGCPVPECEPDLVIDWIEGVAIWRRSIDR